MFIRFDSDAGTFIMHAEHAEPLIRMMGHSGEVPSALLAKDVPAALDTLLKELARAPKPPAPAAEDDEETSVTLDRRAYPLIELLKLAAKKRCDVLWSVEPAGSIRS
ncbi:MAG: DUF1840 domain-containing protein [Betaproteobacteria bacterium]|nr:DUF1840 domain-containing protein [Betaproteobacteria bacterium]